VTRKIKGLSLWQPWASLIAIGSKSVETRSWATSYRGWLAIHASKKWSKSIFDLVRSEPYHSCLCSAPGSGHSEKGTAMVRGAIVAVARLVDVRSTNEFQPDSEIELAFGDYSPDRYAWLLEDVTRIEPVACPGTLGLWDLPFVSLQEVRARYQEAREALLIQERT
jgi:activating signal cointegrator 1